MATAKDLQDAGKALNVASDQFNESLSLVEALLKRLSLGVPAWVDMPEKEGSESGYQFGYSKYGGKWGLYVSERNTITGKLVHCWPMPEVSRPIRVQVAVLIPDLLDAMMLRANDMRVLMEKRSQETKAFVVAMSAALEEPNGNQRT